MGRDYLKFLGFCEEVREKNHGWFEDAASLFTNLTFKGYSFIFQSHIVGLVSAVLFSVCYSSYSSKNKVR